MARGYPSHIQKAFDELRFGPSRTLNLRASLPSADEARGRAEGWLQAKQMERAGEVLVITGRGNNSIGGVSAVREAVLALLPSLRRRNIITGWTEHTAGSFAVTLAPINALFDTARRRREPIEPPVPVPESLTALSPETLNLLRRLAVSTLAVLGVHDFGRFVQGEMANAFARLSAALPGSDDPEAELRRAIHSALDELDDLDNTP